jgi:signal transduction histidine kinase
VPDVHWAREVIDRQVQTLSRLIDDLMDVSRVNQRNVKLQREHVELAKVVQGAIETSRPLIEEMGHELVVTQPTDLVTVAADPTR